MQLVEFTEDINDDVRLTMLYALHDFKETVKIDEEDKTMIVMALNRTDVASVETDEEGGLVIRYYGDEWEQNE